MKTLIFQFLLVTFCISTPVAQAQGDESSGENSAVAVSDLNEPSELVQEAADVARLEIEESMVGDILRLFELPEAGHESYFLAARTRGMVQQILKSISNSGLKAENLSFVEERRLYQQVLEALAEEGSAMKTDGEFRDWWPFIFLSYTLPFVIEDETRAVEQNLQLFETAFQDTNSEETTLEKLVHLHEENNTPFLGYARVAKAVGNMTLLTQESFDKLISTLDRYSLGYASKTFNLLLKNIGLNRENFSQLSLPERALLVVDMVSWIPILNVKAQIFVFIGTFTARRINDVLKLTGTDKIMKELVKSYVEKFGLDDFKTNYPFLASVAESAQWGLDALGRVGQSAMGLGRSATVSVLNSTLPSQVIGGARSLSEMCGKLLSGGKSKDEPKE